MEVKCEKLSNRFDYVCCDNHLTVSLSFERMENAHITVFFLCQVHNRCVIQVSLFFDYTLVPCCLP